MPTSRHQIDQDYLLELITTFPYSPENPTNLREANKKIHSRHTALSWDHKDSILDIFPENGFDLFVHTLPIRLHEYLYQEILSNAGQYRKADEPNCGVVRFGPNRRYQGAHPSHIEEGIRESLNLLQNPSSTPIYRSLKFYQRFVYIHPFYDANGRIGRFIVSLYLSYHNYFVDWEDLERNTKWLKTLNKCHDRMTATPDVYEQFVKYLVQHWKSSIRPLPDQDLDD